MDIYLVRHPQPVDVDGLCYGRLDVAVTEQAIATAAEAVRAKIPGETLDCARTCAICVTRVDLAI